MSAQRPPLLLRLAVVVGAFTLLLGIAGVFLVVLRGDDDASAAGPGLREHVRVVGAAADASLDVEVHWEEGANLHVEAARRLASPGHVFLLPPELTGRAVDDRGPRVTDRAPPRARADRGATGPGGPDHDRAPTPIAERLQWISPSPSPAS